VKFRTTLPHGNGSITATASDERWAGVLLEALIVVELERTTLVVPFEPFDTPVALIENDSAPWTNLSGAPGVPNTATVPGTRTRRPKSSAVKLTTLNRYATVNTVPAGRVVVAAPDLSVSASGIEKFPAGSSREDAARISELSPDRGMDCAVAAVPDPMRGKEERRNPTTTSGTAHAVQRTDRVTRDSATNLG
jgi:hypothetical protein